MTTQRLLAALPVALALALAGCEEAWPPEDAPTAEPAAPEAAPAEQLPGTVDVAELLEAYAERPETADRKYKGKWVTVSGKVLEVDTFTPTEPGAVHVDLFAKGTSGRMFVTERVVCLLKDPSEAESLRRLQKIAIRGKVVGRLDAKAVKRPAGKEVGMVDCTVTPSPREDD